MIHVIKLLSIIMFIMIIIVVALRFTLISILHDYADMTSKSCKYMFYYIDSGDVYHHHIAAILVEGAVRKLNNLDDNLAIEATAFNKTVEKLKIFCSNNPNVIWKDMLVYYSK